MQNNSDVFNCKIIGQVSIPALHKMLIDHVLNMMSYTIQIRLKLPLTKGMTLPALPLSPETDGCH